MHSAARKIGGAEAQERVGLVNRAAARESSMTRYGKLSTARVCMCLRVTISMYVQARRCRPRIVEAFKCSDKIL